MYSPSVQQWMISELTQPHHTTRVLLHLLRSSSTMSPTVLYRSSVSASLLARSNVFDKWLELHSLAFLEHKTVITFCTLNSFFPTKSFIHNYQSLSFRLIPLQQLNYIATVFVKASSLRNESTALSFTRLLNNGLLVNNLELHWIFAAIS